MYVSSFLPPRPIKRCPGLVWKDLSNTGISRYYFQNTVKLSLIVDNDPPEEYCGFLQLSHSVVTSDNLMAFPLQDNKIFTKGNCG